MDSSSVKMRTVTIETIEIKENSRLYLFSKRCLDILGALIGLVFFVVSFIFVYFFYKAKKNSGPILHKQRMLRKNGRYFERYTYVAPNNQLACHEDPRLTKFEEFLCKSYIDDLPQFINVLKGSMSLVGTRPIVTVELNEYGIHKAAFLSVKPGITGYWAVKNQSKVDYPERINLELHYVSNQSFLFDLKILFMTVIRMILRRGS